MTEWLIHGWWGAWIQRLLPSGKLLAPEGMQLLLDRGWLFLELTGVFDYGMYDRGLSASGFFFSSRRRHTRCGRDWSSDVCSSDLQAKVEVVLLNGWFSGPTMAVSRVPRFPFKWTISTLN